MTKLFNLGLHVSALVATPALADPPSPGHNRSIVRTADLDLGSADGNAASTAGLSRRSTRHAEWRPTPI